MDYALEKKVSGLFVGDAAGFERWVAVSAGLPDQERKAFLDDVTAFARAKGSPIDIAGELNQLVEQESAIRVLVGFAKLKNPALDVTNRKAVQDWYRAQTRVSEAQLNDFLTEVARYAAAEGSDIPLSPNLLRTLDFTAFTEAYVGRPTGEHAALIDDLRSAEEVWAMVKKAQQDLSLARGQEVQRVLRDNDLRNKGWDPPTKPKGDYAIDYVLP